MSLEYDKANIVSDELVSHFLVANSEFNVLENRVRYKALLPSQKHQNISVVRTRNMSENEVWQWGRTNVKLIDKQALYARAQMIVSDIISLDLRITPDEPPERHANVFNWPSEKHAVKSVAQELAARCSLILP